MHHTIFEKVGFMERLPKIEVEEHVKGAQACAMGCMRHLFCIMPRLKYK